MIVGGGVAKISRTKLDMEWSFAVRSRDHWTCQKCGSRYPPKKPGDGSSRSGLDAAHIFSRRLKRIRHDLDNGVALCTGCHLSWAHYEPLEFREWIMEWLGADKYEALRLRAQEVKK